MLHTYKACWLSDLTPQKWQRRRNAVQRSIGRRRTMNTKNKPVCFYCGEELAVMEKSWEQLGTDEVTALRRSLDGCATISVYKTTGRQRQHYKSKFNAD
ncbi:hypothetical protein XENOCAPTIV_010336 [Xenoophorus captivus]|uniref:Uncharacterized protein n=1 Tax=Xenoophorus captivus TaxID=1517983 RepID=A0ABV0QV70_9TELE